MKLNTKFMRLFFLSIILSVFLVFLFLLHVNYIKYEDLLKHLNIGISDRALSIIVVIAFIIVVFLFTCFIYKSWIEPVNKLSDAMKRVSEGDLDFAISGSGSDELQKTFKNLEQIRKRLKDTVEEKARYDKENREIISNISHDLKTPVTAIKGYIEGIMDGVADTPEKKEKYFRTIYNKANDMERLINELTIYSRIETNKIPYFFHSLNVNDYFNDCKEELTVELESKGIEFIYDTTVPDDEIITADSEQLKKVINNIISNSIKYMDKKPKRIRMHISDVTDSVKVEIEDNGKGIAKKDIPRVFDRFYRTDSSRNSEQGGSGIGLSIVKRIVEDHGGYIWATSEENKGTTICFVLRKKMVDWDE